MSAVLGANSYGKSAIRLVKVVRTGDRHEIRDFTVDVALEGVFERAHTAGDNSMVLPTDTMKNTVYAKAREHPVREPEDFARVLVEHFLNASSAAARARVRVAEHSWRHVDVDGRPHDTTFERAGVGRRGAGGCGSRNMGGAMSTWPGGRPPRPSSEPAASSGWPRCRWPGAPSRVCAPASTGCSCSSQRIRRSRATRATDTRRSGKRTTGFSRHRFPPNGAIGTARPPTVRCSPASVARCSPRSPSTTANPCSTHCTRWGSASSIPAGRSTRSASRCRTSITYWWISCRSDWIIPMRSSCRRRSRMGRFAGLSRGVGKSINRRGRRGAQRNSNSKQQEELQRQQEQELQRQQEQELQRQQEQELQRQQEQELQRQQEQELQRQQQQQQLETQRARRGTEATEGCFGNP